MPLQEFWYENPDLLWVYRTSFINKRKEEVEFQHECINYQAWLIGVYVQQAIGSAFNKKIHYPSQPFDVNGGKASKKDLEQRIRQQLNRGKNLIKKENTNGG